MRFLVLIGILGVLPPGRLCALERAESMPYLRCSADAKSSALAGAVGALGGDVETLWVNPAGLGGLPNPRISLTGLFWRNGVESQYLLSGFPLSRGWAVGVAVNRNSAMDQYRDGTGAPGGSFEVSDTVLCGAVAYRRGRWSVGTSVKWVHERVESYRGSGFLADIGFQVLPLRDWVALGVAYQNIGSVSSLAEGARPPGTLRCSAAVRVYGPNLVLVAESRTFPTREETIPAVGFQFTERRWPLGVALRGGYDFQDLKGLGGSGWTLGVGLAWRDLRLDYAYSPSNILGTRQRLTVGWEFQTRPKRSTSIRGGAIPPPPDFGTSESTLRMPAVDAQAPMLPSGWPGMMGAASPLITPRASSTNPPSVVGASSSPDRAMTGIATPLPTPAERMKVELEYQDL